MVILASPEGQRALDMLKSWMSVPRSAILGIITILLVSCAPKWGFRPETGVPYEGPVTVDALRKSIVFNDLRAVRSEVKAKVLKQGISGGRDKKIGKFKGVFLYLYPEHMRLRAYDPFGAPVMDMVSASGLTQVYFPGNGVLYEGSAPALGVPDDALYEMKTYEDRYILIAHELGLDRREYYFDPVTLRNTGMAVYMDGKRFLVADFAAFSGPAPMRIRLSFANGFIVEMELKKPAINGEVPLRFFDPIEHRDRTVLPLERLMRSSPPS
jgi:hypothetical protein